jgi:serine phosphatase RsbU (regulator of sigma subunit)
MIAARLLVRQACIEYVNAGHEGGLIVQPGETARPLVASGPLISPALAELGWQKRRLPWSSASVVLLYTDGFSEARRDDAFFGVERIHRLAEERHESLTLLLKMLVEEVREFCGGRTAIDDMTILGAREE